MKASTLIYHRNFTTELPEKYSKVLNRLSREDSVLEVGCHTGYFSRVILDKGYDISGIEKDPDDA